MPRIVLASPETLIDPANLEPWLFWRNSFVETGNTLCTGHDWDH
jgi:hypothetical protein